MVAQTCHKVIDDQTDDQNEILLHFIFKSFVFISFPFILVSFFILFVFFP